MYGLVVFAAILWISSDNYVKSCSVKVLEKGMLKLDQYAGLEDAWVKW